MTEPGSTGRLVPESRPDTTGPTDALPTRRSLRAQRSAESRGEAASAPSGDLVVPAVQWPAPGGVDARDVRADAAPSGAHSAVEAPAVPVAAHPVDDAHAVEPRRTRRLAVFGRSLAVRPPKTPAVERPKVKAERRPWRSLATFVIIPGLFLTVALPAYAALPSGDGTFAASKSAELSKKDAQSVEVPSFSAKITVARDGYTAVSGEEIRRKAEEARLAAERQAYQARAGAYSTPSQRAEGDDYPYWDQPVGVLSPLRYEYRECVDFVAWRLNRDRGSTSAPFAMDWGYLTPGGGSAWNWANAWESHGWQVSHDPIVGSVAWFTYNHVAYVQSVNGDGTVTIEEYNQNSDHQYHRRTIANGSVALFLYPPP